MSPRIIILSLCILGILLGARYLFLYIDTPSLAEGTEVKITTLLLEETNTYPFYQSYTGYVANIHRVSIRLPRYPKLLYGDRITVRGRIQVKEGKRGDTYFVLSYPEALSQTSSQSLFIAFPRFIREKVSETFHKTLPTPADALLLGIVLGIDEGMPESFEKSLQQGGVMHVIAASGMNVSMVAGACFFIFQRYFSRKKAILISLVMIIFYAILSGAQPSILRATLMGGLVFLSQLFGRQNTGILTLIFTGTIMLFIRPILLFDVGFQLSFMATGGILLLKPLFDQFTNTWKYESFLDDVKTTLAAQITTLPILLFTFGEYGVLSLLINALVLWTVPLLMILGGSAAIVSLIFPILSIPLLYLTMPFLWWFIYLVTLLGSLPISLTLPSLPLFFSGSFYLFLGGVILLLRRKGSQV